MNAMNPVRQDARISTHRKRLADVFAIVVVSGWFGLGCFDVSPPNDATFSCEVDGDCLREGEVCDDRVCRVPSGDVLQVENPSIEPHLVGAGFVEQQQSVSLSFSLSASQTELPKVSILDALSDELTENVEARIECVDAAATTCADFLGTLILPQSVLEGQLLVRLRARDSQGAERTLRLGVIDVDRTAPSIVGVSFERTPDPALLRSVALQIAGREGPVGPSTAVRVGFSTNEPVVVNEVDGPQVELVSSGLSFVRDTTIANPYFFDLAWPAVVDASMDGTFRVFARVVDLAGNVTEQELELEPGEGAPDIVVDTTPPAPPVVEIPGRIVFERAPWGRSEMPDLDVYTVVGGEEAVQPNTFVVVTTDPEGRREIGATLADDTGAFGGLESLPLVTGDPREVYLLVADRAGNTSAPTRVQEGLWIASLGGKVAGELGVNPHAFEEVPIFFGGTSRRATTELNATDGLEAPDSEFAETLGAGTWTRLSSDESDSLSPPEGVLIQTAFGHDPASGISVLFGGRQLQDDQKCVGQVDAVWIRGRDGRFRQKTFLPGEPRPTAMRGARFAFEPKRQRLVLIGGSVGPSEMWAFKDNTFQQLCTSEACASTLPTGLTLHGLIHDPVRQTFLLVRKTGKTYEFDGQVWTEVCDGGDCAPQWSGEQGTLVFDDRRGMPVWFDGADLFSWTGTAWTKLCDDAECEATKPPLRRDASAAYDRTRGVVVVFGGQAVADADADADANLDGGVDVDAGPPNPTQAVLCNFGSQSGQNADAAVLPFNDTWEFDGSTWTQKTPTESPPGRAQHVMGWDETRQKVIVSGGDDCNCNQKSSGIIRFRLGWDEDFWEWDGETWTRVDVPPSVPEGFVAEPALKARDHDATNAPAHAGIVLYGDSAGDQKLHLLRQGRFYQSTELVDGVGPFLPGLTTSPDGNIYVSGGGTLGQTVRSLDAQFMHRVEGNQVVIDCDACGFSPERQPYGHGFVHDGTQLVFFGGNVDKADDVDSGVADSGVAGSGVADGGVADAGPVDAGAEVEFVAEGAFSLQDLAEDSVLTYNDVDGFVERCNGNGDACSAVPSPRMRAKLASTGTLSETLLFGGLSNENGNNKTWTFNGAEWIEEDPSVVPPKRQGHVLVYDAGRNAVVLTSGTPFSFKFRDQATQRESIAARFGDVYEWANGDWHLTRVVDPEGDGEPSRRFGAAAAYDPVVGGVMLHGGTPTPEIIPADVPTEETTRLDDVWHWQGGETTRPAQRFRVSLLAANLPAAQVVTSVEVRWFTQGDLQLWDGFGWKSLAVTSCGVGCQGATIDSDLVHRSAYRIK